MGNDPPQFSIFWHGRRSCAAICQITRKGEAIIGIGKLVFGSIDLFSLHARGSSLREHSGQQARSSVLTITVRFGARSPTAVVCSRELVSCGNGGTLP